MIVIHLNELMNHRQNTFIARRQLNGHFDCMAFVWYDRQKGSET